MTSIKDFLSKINTSPVVRSYVAMDRGYGFPMLSIVGDRLLVTVFYYRVLPRKDDKSLIMPPEYVLSFDYPSCRLASFEALRMSPHAEGVDFEKPVGTFRHDAIKDLDRAAYQAKRDELNALLDKLIANLGGEGEFTDEDERQLAALYQLLTEPSLHPAYRICAPQFFSRFIAE